MYWESSLNDVSAHISLPDFIQDQRADRAKRLYIDCFSPVYACILVARVPVYVNSHRMTDGRVGTLEQIREALHAVAGRRPPSLILRRRNLDSLCTRSCRHA